MLNLHCFFCHCIDVILLINSINQSIMYINKTKVAAILRNIFKPFGVADGPLPTWSQRFKRFRLADYLQKEEGDIQASSLLYAMGDQSETILKTFALTDVEQNDFDTVMSNVYTDREDQLAVGFGLT